MSVGASARPALEWGHDDCRGRTAARCASPGTPFARRLGPARAGNAATTAAPLTVDRALVRARARARDKRPRSLVRRAPPRALASPSAPRWSREDVATSQRAIRALQQAARPRRRASTTGGRHVPRDAAFNEPRNWDTSKVTSMSTAVPPAARPSISRSVANEREATTMRSTFSRRPALFARPLGHDLDAQDVSRREGLQRALVRSRRRRRTDVPHDRRRDARDRL